MKLGVSATAMVDDRTGTVPNPADIACHVEDLGLDSFWVSDHLAWDTPIIDSVVALATAAAMTETVDLGFAVLQLALRPLALVAKQIGSLQVVSEDRLQLGIGVGGQPVDEWIAAGSSLQDRGRRTDEALNALPDLLAGRRTELPDVHAPIQLTPAAVMPPVWIGGDSPAALARVAATSAGWLPAAQTPDAVAQGARTVADTTGTKPPLAVSLFGTLNEHHGGMSHDALVDLCVSGFGFSRERAEAVTLSGGPTEVAASIAAYADIGVEHVIVVPFGPDWQHQCELLAEARAELDPAGATLL